jgi:type I restriction enzyme S subunit
MKLRPYPENKDTGVQWLGNIPKQWNLTPLKYHFKIVGGSTPKSDQEHYWDGDVKWVTPSDLSKLNSFYIHDSQRKITLAGLNSCGSSLVPKGSVVLSTRAPIGTIGIAFTEVCTNQGCKSLVPDNQSNPIFYTYLLSICSVELNLRGKGTTFLELSADELGSFKVGFPTLNEQLNIVRFLDRETAKLDNLIAKQEKLIELLKEKRQAIISHAVTKGLDPSVKMKDSGLDWLGMVPEHWVITRLKYLGDAIIGLTYDPTEVVDETEGTLILRSSNIQQGVVSFDDNVYVNKQIPEKLFTRIGDILICSRNGSRKLIGKNITINEQTVGLSFGAFMTIFRSKYYKYVSCILNSSLFEFQAGSFLTSTVNQLTTGNLNSFEVPFPPEDEQIEIASYVNKQTNKIDTLISKAEKSIELAKEHRTALISAAVTGKIDVREYEK